jgi:TonB family protein
VIPVARYFTRFEELLSHQAETTQQATAVPKETIHVGELIAWDESLPAIRKPHRGNSILNVDLAYNRLDLSFTINSRGKVSAVKVLGAEPDERSVRRKALRALRDVQFRPAIVGDKATRLRDVQIRYLFLQE